MDQQLFRVPDVNFFQYPPLRDIPAHDAANLRQKLDLWRLGGSSDFAVFVSVPYCRVRCNSCPFFKALLPSPSGASEAIGRVTEAIMREVQHFSGAARFDVAQCGAVYMGGGTASLLPPDHVARLIERIGATFNVVPDVEITLEGNPRDFTLEYLKAIRQEGVTRISVGLQGFSERQLRGSLNSPHRAADSHAVAEAIVNSGISSANVDLLYRVPGQTADDWQLDVETLLAYGPPSIKMYEYVVYENTASETLLKSNRLDLPVDKATAFSWYNWAARLLRSHGYVEHRMGSFSRPGHEQRYGAIAYDQGLELVGLGAGAYSFVNGYQFANAGDPAEHEQRIRAEMFPAAARLSVKATARHLMERFIIFSLMSSRIDRAGFMDKFGEDIFTRFSRELELLIAIGLVEIDASAARLTELGRMWRRRAMYEFYGVEFRPTSTGRAA